MGALRQCIALPRLSPPPPACCRQHVNQEHASPDSPVAVFGGCRGQAAGAICSRTATECRLHGPACSPIATPQHARLSSSASKLLQAPRTAQCWPPGCGRATRMSSPPPWHRAPRCSPLWLTGRAGTPAPFGRCAGAAGKAELAWWGRLRKLAACAMPRNVCMSGVRCVAHASLHQVNPASRCLPSLPHPHPPENHRLSHAPPRQRAAPAPPAPPTCAPPLLRCSTSLPQRRGGH